MKTKTINLGYFAIEGYTPARDLNPSWDDGDKKVDATEKVLNKGTYTLVIEYPLSTAFKKKFTTKGMTRRELVTLICKSYKAIYDAEDKAAGKTENIPGMFNRQTSAGPYGIWGHCLGDLILHTATVQKSGNITVGVDS